MMTRLLADIGDTAIWVSSAGIVVFIVQYSLLAAWWRNAIGITMVGEALALLAIYIPTLMALADPADYQHFAQARWYLYLTVGIVVATAAFITTRIITWEAIRRQRSHVLSPQALAARVAQLEGENAGLRERLGET